MAGHPTPMPVDGPTLTEAQRSGAANEVLSYIQHLEQQLQQTKLTSEQAAQMAVAAAQAVQAAQQAASGSPPANSDSGGGLPKPDTFNGAMGKGSIDVETWLFQVRNYLAASRKPESTWVAYASALLRGPAATWWRVTTLDGDLQRSDPWPWSTFSTALKNNFKPINSVQHAEDRVATLRQRRSATEYCNEFRLLTLDIPGMDEEWKLDAFLRGLKPNDQRDLERYPPSNLADAMWQAERIDAVDFEYSSRKSGNSSGGSRTGSGGAAAVSTMGQHRWSSALSTAISASDSAMRTAKSCAGRTDASSAGSRGTQNSSVLKRRNPTSPTGRKTPGPGRRNRGTCRDSSQP